MASNFWATQTTLAPLMSKDAKAQLAYSGKTFDVVAVKMGETQEYGPCWFVEISDDGFRQAVAFSPNETRDQQFRDMQDFLKENPGSGIPASLASFRTKGGFTAYAIQPPQTAPQPSLFAASDYIDIEPPF